MYKKKNIFIFKINSFKNIKIYNLEFLMKRIS